MSNSLRPPGLYPARLLCPSGFSRQEYWSGSHSQGFSLSCLGEGNGHPLQCSCLENPRDGGAWWAVVCGVAESRTRLKRLSGSSSSIVVISCQFSQSVVSNFVRPHRWQPTRLPCPWDSPGKNTGVGCHFLLQCKKVKSESEAAQSCQLLGTPWTAAYQAPLSMGFSRQEYWSGCHRLLHCFTYLTANY